MSGIHKMKVNFYTTDGSEVEDRSHECEVDSLEGLQNLVSEIIDQPSLGDVRDDIISVELDLHIRNAKDIRQAIYLLGMMNNILPDK